MDTSSISAPLSLTTNLSPLQVQEKEVAKLKKLLISTIILAFLSVIVLVISTVYSLTQRDSKIDTVIQPPSSLILDTTEQYKNAAALSFSFSYPNKWNVSNYHTSTNQYFFLDPNPIIVTTEYYAFISGRGFERSDKTKLKDAIDSFVTNSNNKNISELDWKIGTFPGKCFKYDTLSGQYGEVKNNIECFVLINVPDRAGYQPSQTFLYDFTVFNFANVIQKIDPDLSIVRHFISSLDAYN